ncbi:hypothetical protein ACIBKY_52325 [Nonomuraea sp. NPDC050394]|uniref:hypothetical protein n=1 Tax=Nonomuraea sp. NPDC050394 TaxID=3364363 RepID=UPI0037B15788
MRVGPPACSRPYADLPAPQLARRRAGQLALVVEPTLVELVLVERRGVGQPGLPRRDLGVASPQKCRELSAFPGFRRLRLAGPHRLLPVFAASAWPDPIVSLLVELSLWSGTGR